MRATVRQKRAQVFAPPGVVPQPDTVERALYVIGSRMTNGYQDPPNP